MSGFEAIKGQNLMVCGLSGFGQTMFGEYVSHENPGCPRAVIPHLKTVAKNACATGERFRKNSSMLSNQMLFALQIIECKVKFLMLWPLLHKVELEFKLKIDST